MKIRSLLGVFAFLAMVPNIPASAQHTVLSGAALTLAVAGTIPAGPFGMQPRVLTMTRSMPIAELQFSSLYAHSRVFDVRVLRWTQRDGQEVLTPDDGFIVVPAVFSIEPYQTVIVRIEQRASAERSVEQSYKVVATSVVPGASTPPPVARRVEAMLFVPPAAPAPDAAFTLKATAPGEADLIVNNRGNAHLYLGNVSIESAQHEIYAGTIDDYVLADASRTFHLHVPGAISEANADLTYDDAQGRRQICRVIVTR